MTAIAYPGCRTWSGKQDDDGHRTYTVKRLVKAAKTDSIPDVLKASGLNIIGDNFPFGGGDSSAWCHPDMDVSIHEEKEGEPAIIYVVGQTFSTRPIPRCMTTLITTPVADPPVISGSFTKYTEEATFDYFGNPITNSALEQIKGQEVERDFNRPSIKIQMNVSPLPLVALAQAVDTVNSVTLWGLPPRTIKLSNVGWERKVYNLCTYYYDLTFEFEVNYNTWDKTVLDEGTKQLAPGGNPADQRQYERFKDQGGDNTHCILDGRGNPWVGGVVPITGVTNTFPLSTITTASFDAAISSQFLVGDLVIIGNVQGAGGVNGRNYITNVLSSTSFEVTVGSAPGAFVSSPQATMTDISGVFAPGSVFIQFYSQTNFAAVFGASFPTSL